MILSPSIFLVLQIRFLGGTESLSTGRRNTAKNTVPVNQRGGQPASLFGFGCQYKFSGGQNGFETENGLASPLPHTGHTSRWRTRRRLSLPSTAMSGAGTLTPERVDQPSFTRSMVIEALVARGVSRPQWGRLAPRSWGASTSEQMCIQAVFDSAGALRHMNKNNSERAACTMQPLAPKRTFF